MTKFGSIGAEAHALQRLLGIERTGYFDEATAHAVRAFQQQHGLVADGIVGEKTLYALNLGKANAQHLTMADIERAAKALGVLPAVILAVNEVESRGTGFLSDGRIVILYERHIMYRQLTAQGLDANSYALNFPNLVNTKRGGYIGGSAEHARLRTAKQIDESAALEACSFGLFQIMGFHWQALGYKTAQEFVAFMQKNEGNQLTVFVQFILADATLHKALKAKKWAEFARIYNGPAYQQNFYDAKLAQAYARHAA